MLLRQGSAMHATRMLWKIAAVRIRGAADGLASGVSRLTQGEGVVFPAVDAGLIAVDPDQVEALRVCTEQSLLSIEPERAIEVAHSANAGSSEATAFQPFAGFERPFDETADTWGLQATRVTASRFTGRGVRVAILDSGLDVDHPDFAGRAIVSASFVSDSSVHDTNGHGTYCAGVACGPVVAHQGPRYGVASAADLYVGKIVDHHGSGADGDILTGIDWAVRNDCAVISLSVGATVMRGEPYSTIFEQVAERALAAGTLIVGATGNTSLRPDCIAPVDHPANCPSILAVSAVDCYGRIAPFSCGGVHHEGSQVDIAGPGVAVRSSWPRPALYRAHSGTSMASPHVAGIAALMLEANPSLRGRQLRDQLRRSARPLGLPARDVGAGLVQAP